MEPVPGSRRLFLKTTMRLIINQTRGSLLWLWPRGARSTRLNLWIPSCAPSTAMRNNLKLFANLSDIPRALYRCQPVETDLLNSSGNSSPFCLSKRSDFVWKGLRVLLTMSSSLSKILQGTNLCFRAILFRHEYSTYFQQQRVC